MLWRVWVDGKKWEVVSEERREKWIEKMGEKLKKMGWKESWRGWYLEREIWLELMSEEEVKEWMEKMEKRRVR